jgi:hypothetical protein
VALLCGLVAAVTAVLAELLPPSARPPAAAPRDELPRNAPRPARSAPARALGLADGAVPEGTTVFDDTVPGVARLDPQLLAAVRRAATAAGMAFVVDSGWRSPAYQEHLLDEAVERYGSRAAAARWVATPATSAHVRGDAVDLGPAAAAAWLSARGAAYGLCQSYANEPWHYELRPRAAVTGCPAMYADPTHDPRTHQ